MEILGVFNSLNLTANLMFQDKIVNQIIHSTCSFLLNASAYSYLLIKFYKILCYTDITLKWFPMINPYYWPYSFFRQLTQPYFSFWARILPPIKFERSAVEVSTIIGIQFLEALNFFCAFFMNFLTTVVENTK